jgi:hypothetical protein
MAVTILAKTTEHMIDALKALLKQPYWVITLILGAVLVALPCMTIDKDNHLATHPPSTLVSVIVGIGLLALSGLIFGFTLWAKHKTDENTGVSSTRIHNEPMCGAWARSSNFLPV